MVCIAFLLANSVAWAVPNYGVATNGTYYGEDGDELENYQAYFVGADFISGSIDYHGFGFGDDGGDGSITLHVWTNQPTTETWLLAENNFSDNSLIFDGLTFEETDALGSGNGQIDGYTNYSNEVGEGYWGINLGTVFDELTGEINDGWFELPEDPFNPGTFYVYSGTLTYSGLDEDDIGYYLFSGGDIDLVDGISTYPDEITLTGGEFSPKTTSSQAVPEPTTLLLLGIGLLGIVGSAAKKNRKKAKKL